MKHDPSSGAMRFALGSLLVAAGCSSNGTPSVKPPLTPPPAVDAQPAGPPVLPGSSDAAAVSPPDTAVTPLDAGAAPDVAPADAGTEGGTAADPGRDPD